ncbi:hypothetical protein [Gimesia chilikensis]|jgi:hypothetical protein|uniref:Uncharacterized protein n=1 Tax=Gimesia chilikensis TaxID=2605989 RepID=A0A517W8F5_9PLAN|nr:hypothetical protein [Gimesia chilikensis]MBN69744.1 hypothetical protein [Gimesia sp.]MCR9232885.1 hypothetical protein [bacterium]QDT19479.1 hypothetical protein HG66A1_12440 [Gimesia chilikensis]QDT83564.1 hypothetical protein MalM14_11960 [Gimesia chilikensis]QDU01520.1 hypothetical protein V6x_12000 [Gimesia chilikensis]
MPEYSNYQKDVIKRYYDNRESIDQQRLSELCTNLFLTEGKKKQKLWEKAQEIMERLNVPPTRIDHVLKSADPAILAEVVKDLESGAIR